MLSAKAKDIKVMLECSRARVQVQSTTMLTSFSCFPLYQYIINSLSQLHFSLSVIEALYRTFIAAVLAMKFKTTQTQLLQQNNYYHCMPNQAVFSCSDVCVQPPTQMEQKDKQVSIQLNTFMWVEKKLKEKSGNSVQQTSQRSNVCLCLRPFELRTHC